MSPATASPPPACLHLLLFSSTRLFTPPPLLLHPVVYTSSSSSPPPSCLHLLLFSSTQLFTPPSPPPGCLHRLLLLFSSTQLFTPPSPPPSCLHLLLLLFSSTQLFTPPSPPPACLHLLLFSVLCCQSVTGHFSDGGDDEVEVSCSLERKQFVLFRGDGRRGTPLKRPAFCPIKHLSVSQSAAIPLDVQRRGVDVGVAIILQTANRRVLLTRRAKELRIFPNVWVPPGGHLEPEETLLEAGLRELKEETGLDLEPEGVSPKILGLWESVYPPMLSRGLPQRHHIVVYMLLLSRLSHLQLQASLRPSPAEVSACLWADRQLVGAVVSSVDAEDGHVPLHRLQGSVSVSQVFSDGALSEAALPLEVLLGRAPACGLDVERVSTGTKFALELWLKSLEDLRPLTPPEKML